ARRGDRGRRRRGFRRGRGARDRDPDPPRSGPLAAPDRGGSRLRRAPRRSLPRARSRLAVRRDRSPRRLRDRRGAFGRSVVRGDDDASRRAALAVGARPPPRRADPRRRGATTGALSAPPLGWDALTYHLFRAGRWVHDGHASVVTAPDAWGYYE